MGIYEPPVITIEGNMLKAADHFMYLGSMVSNDVSFAKATTAFGRLSKRLWTSGIRFNTKISIRLRS